MKLGTEDKKKTYAAAALMVVALGTVYVQFFSGAPAVPSRPPPTPRAVTSTRAIEPQARSVRQLSGQTTARRRLTGTAGEFDPIWQRSHEDEAFDPLQADPTLRTELLAAVRGTVFRGVDRNIFRFTTRRAKPAPPPPADLVKKAQEAQAEFEKSRAEAAAAAKSAPAPKRAPRITWKYYGFASEAGDSERRAFLLDGEDVLIAGPGDLLQGGRYKVVRIGLTSIVIEDTEFKEEQTLQITMQGNS